MKHTSLPWTHSQEIVSARQQRDWLHRQALKSGNPDIWSSYRHCHNKVTAMTRSAKCKSSLVSNFKHDSPKFWKHFSYLSSHLRSHHQINLNVTSEDIDQHFLSVAQWTVSELLPSHTSPISYIGKNTNEIV